jgi:hypothetical protein
MRDTADASVPACTVTAGVLRPGAVRRIPLEPVLRVPRR